MKKLLTDINASRDPDTNPSDRAEAIVQSLDVTLKRLRKLYRSCKHMYESNGSDDDLMMTLSDNCGDMVKELDLIVDKYENVILESAS